MNIRHILVPVDFSPYSKPALQTAEELAAKFAAPLTLYHVLEPAPLPVTDVGFIWDPAYQEMTNAAEKELKDLAASVPPGISVKYAVETGVPWDSIVNYAAAHSVDLIVMPTHGRSGLKHLWLGSVAERVVQHARCPVFVIRGEGGFKSAA
jgi:nucleotide-binding universal stress UspA family protein